MIAPAGKNAGTVGATILVVVPTDSLGRLTENAVVVEISRRCLDR